MYLFPVKHILTRPHNHLTKRVLFVFLEHSSDNSNEGSELRHIVISDSNMTLTFLPLSVWKVTPCENLR